MVPAANPGALRFLLGLPHIRRGPILERARALGCPVLLSANAFSRWRTAPGGWREWLGWDLRDLANLAGIPAHLDSAGFVAMMKYRGWEWSVEKYIQLAAAYPWQWFAAMDLCCEPEIADKRDQVRDRIAGTIALFNECRRDAQRAGIADRLLPVMQGQHPDDYIYCMDRFPVAAWPSLIGVGSMCRRPVNGAASLLAVVDAIDRALGTDPVKLHLFGVKTTGAEALRGHPRVATTDSQAYGSAARWDAVKAGISKTDDFVAQVMGEWHQRQENRLAQPGFAFQPSLAFDVPAEQAPRSLFAEAEQQIRAELRELVEAGEVEWNYLFYVAGMEEMVGERYQELLAEQSQVAA